MCRLLAYLGSTVQLDRLLYKPQHSLIVQSYQPQEMTSGLLNADGFGLGWYHPQKQDLPYTYRNTQPIWSDLNLAQITRYIEAKCIVSYVRSATPGLAVDLSNCQPFTHENIVFIHNGYINNFRNTLYRSIRSTLNDSTYQSIHGTTDSEHIFALIINQLQINPQLTLQQALAEALTKLTELTRSAKTCFSANIIVSDGRKFVASRYAYEQTPPTLYWLRDASDYPNGVILASEPLFEGNWKSCPTDSIITVEENLEVQIDSIS
ncbi:MAG: ergothioneine biosynthesis protein EgtC [Xenococcaceae cyanobacterium]